MKKNLTILLAVLMFVFSCNREKGTLNPKKIDLSSAGLNLVSSSNQTGIEIFKKFYDGRNNIYSPLSFIYAFGMVYNGAKGNTAENLKEKLNLFYDVQNINPDFKTLTEKLPNVDSKTKVLIANSLWVNKEFNFELKESFEDVIKKYFDGVAKEVNLNNNSGIKEINKWVSKKTKKKIKNVVDESATGSALILVNTLYFKAKWSEKFEDNGKMTFYLKNGNTTKVNSIKGLEKDLIKYWIDTNSVTAVEIPYGKGNYSFFIVMPNSGNIDSLIENLNNENLLDLFAKVKRGQQPVNLYMPKFTIEKSFNLNQTLTELGFKIFANDNPDFSGITEDYDLYISQVIQKDFIELNEEGTEAASATTIQFMTTSVYDIPIDIYIDKPFFYVIKENTTGIILFIGTFTAE